MFNGTFEGKGSNNPGLSGVAFNLGQSANRAKFPALTRPKNNCVQPSKGGC